MFFTEYSRVRYVKNKTIIYYLLCALPLNVPILCNIRLLNVTV